MSKLKYASIAGIVSVLMAGAASTPAAAQPYGDYQRGYGERQRGYDDDDRRHDNGRRGYQDHGQGYAGRNLTSPYVDSLEWRINEAANEGRISRYEARRLLSDLRQIQGPTIYRVENGQANSWEIRQVSRVVSRIEAQTAGRGSRDRYGYRD